MPRRKVHLLIAVAGLIVLGAIAFYFNFISGPAVDQQTRDAAEAAAKAIEQATPEAQRQAELAAPPAITRPEPVGKP